MIICIVCEAFRLARVRAEAATLDAGDALRARRSSEARFRRLAESDVIGVIAGRDECITEGNDAFLRMLGYSRERLQDRGLSVAEITPDALHAEDGRHFDVLFRSGTLSPFEKEYLTVDGETVPVLIGGALVEPGSADWVAFVLDLSRQKRVERELAEAIIRAEAASRSKSEFLAVLSHELITPMNAILGMNQLVLADERDPTVRDYLATAQQSAEALLELLSDLLDYSSIETGSLELAPAPIRLREVVDQAVHPLAARAARKGLELSVRVADDVPNELVGDARRIRQVLVNLLDNAIKFTRQGEVVVAVDLDSQPPNPGLSEVTLRFEVSDTGIGISSEDQEKIFSPFTQIDASSTRPYSGTGLGLSICRQISELMSGAIVVESQQGQGSRFIFSARLHRDEKEVNGHSEPSKKSEEKGPGSLLFPKHDAFALPIPSEIVASSSPPLKILLAEDTLANQKLALAVLRSRGHLVDVASNGREAIDLACRRRYDLVLMDVQMPVMDGLQATAAIRSLDEELGPNVPIVALTAHALRGDQDRCREAGMDGYIAKPIDINSFLSFVEAFSPKNKERSQVNGAARRSASDRLMTTTAPGSTESGAREELLGHDPESLHDRTASLRRLGGDEQLYRDMVGYYFEDYPTLVNQLRSGLISEDSRAVERAAHSLKGLAANCGAGPAVQAAARVEEIGRNQRLAEAPEAVERLVIELHRLRVALDADLQKSSGS